MNRRTFLSTAGAASVGSSLHAIPSVKDDEPHQQRPNLLILQPDQHSAAVTGYGGHPDVLTPHLDRLAAASCNFTHAIANSPVCSPCRASIQSGLYWHTHGVEANGIRLNTGFPTLAEVLNAANYRTGYIGKWHLDGGEPADDPGGFIPPGPRRQGWQEWWGYERNHEYRDVFQYTSSGKRVPVEGYDWEPTWHTDLAMDFMNRTDGPEQPWCCYVSYGPPHKPNQCPKEFLDRYDPSSFELTPAQRNHFPDDPRLLEELHVYYAQVTAIDHEVGRILDFLDASGQADNTIILYCSDHGDVLGSHGRRRGKWKPYSTAFRVPALFHWPNRIPPKRTSALIGAPDWPATLLGLAGIQAPVSWQGHSLADHCFGKSQTLHQALPLGMRGWNGVYDGRYIYSQGRDRVLFDHLRDPYELDNRIDSDPDMVRSMRTLLAQTMQRTGHPEPDVFSQSD
jgi:arylsulfatase A-like enzyme